MSSIVLQIVDVPVWAVKLHDVDVGDGILRIRSLSLRIMPDITLILDTGRIIELGYYSITARHGPSKDGNYVSSKELAWTAPSIDIGSKIAHLTMFTNLDVPNTSRDIDHIQREINISLSTDSR